MIATTPVHVITGFLGSGKTTLLKSVVAEEAFGDSALLINEFGEVGLDDQLLGDIDQETVLLSSGCICCSIRGELAEALITLASRRQSGAIPDFKRVIIETTGLAAPGPIAATLANDIKVRNQFHFGTVLTVVDTQAAVSAQARESVWTDQVAAADSLWFSKTDLVTPGREQAVEALVRAINPTVDRLTDVSARVLDKLFRDRMKPTLLEGTTLFQPHEAGGAATGSANHHQDRHYHLEGIDSFQIELEHAIDWVTFGVWLSLMLHRHGQRLLRVKGLLYLAGIDQPVAIHGVQHTLFPPEHVNLSQTGPNRSRLIFITRGITRQAIVDSLNEFLEKLPQRISATENETL